MIRYCKKIDLWYHDSDYQYILFAKRQCLRCVDKVYTVYQNVPFPGGIPRGSLEVIMQHISFKRMMAMLLALVIVVGLLPVSVLAAESTVTGEFSGTSTVEDAFVVFSDLHIGTNSTDKQALLKNVMAQIKATGMPVSSVASAGDMYSSNESTMTGNASTVTGWVQAVFGTTVPVKYVWSDHDRGTNDISKESGLVYTGNYYVYTLSMADLSSWDRYSAGFYSADQIAQHIEAFKTTVGGLDKSKPLFIVGHQPLFNDRGDNGYAYDWVTAINEVAETMDVVYFYGHNHNYDDNKDCYYYAKGSSMIVPTTKVLSGSGYSTKLETKTVTLNFTHINAGYMDPGSSYTTNARLGTALLVTIYNNKITFTTYDKNGVDKTSYAPIDKDASRDNVKIPKSVAVTGKTDYQVGNGIQAPSSVKVTYMNGSVQTLESGYALTKITDSQGQSYTVNGFTFPKEGTYQLTYTCTVGSYQAQAILTVEAKGEAAPPVTLEDAATGISVTAPGLSRLNVSNVTDQNVLGAVSLKLTGNVKAYDIQVGGFTSGTATVTMPIPEGVTRPAVYYVSDNGAIVERMPITATTETTITFTTTHFSTYVVGEDTEITVPNPTPAIATGTATTTTTKTVYVLVSSLTAGNQYIIVNRNTSGNGYALEENTTTGTSITVNAAGNGISNPYIETTDEALMWNATSGLKLQSENGDYYLRYNNGLGFSTRSSTDWSYSNNSLTYRSGRNSYYLTCSNRGSWSASTSSSSVYFYEKQTIEVETEATVEGKYEVTLTPEQAEIKQVVASDGTTTATLSSTVTFTPNGGAASVVEGATVTYSVVENGDPKGVISGISGNTVTFTGKYGKALIEVRYTLEDATKTATNYIVITASAPYYDIQLHKVELQEATGVTAANFASGNYYVFNETTGFYAKADAFAEGTTYYIAQFTQGNEINAPVALKGIQGGEVFAVWAVVKKYDGTNENGTDMGTLGDALTWTVSDTSIANINSDTGVITFTGEQYGTLTVTVSYTGDDNKPIFDTIQISATKSLYVVPGDGTNDFPDFPEPGAVRFDKTATAVGTFSQTGMAQIELSMTGVPIEKGSDVIIMLDTSSSMTKNEVEGSGGKMRNEVLEAALANLLTLFKTPGANNKPLDIRVAIADFNGYYGDGSNGSTGTPYDRTEGDYVKNGTSNGSGYAQPSAAQIYTGSKTLGAGAFVSVSDLASSYTLNYVSGTNYDYAFDAIYQLGTAIQAKNAEEGKERDLFVIFMSDGASLQWNYFGTQNGYTKWNDWITGAWDKDDLTTTNLNSTKHSYFYDLIDHDGDGQINEHRMANAIKGDPTKRYEVIRKSTAGLPEGTLVSAGKEYLYTVPGLGAKIFTINFDAKQDGQITEANIDKALASTASDQAGATQYYYKVTSADQLSDAFDSIGEGIRYAATDVHVEDKIGKGYVVNFGLPTPNFDKLPDAGMGGIDGKGATEFYMQVLNYKLDPTTNERTGTPTVLEKFTFNLDGTLKSHTVAGSACGDTCNHVTTAGGKITKISGTYFQFEDKGEDGQIMTWTADRLTRDELVLQYFVYLEGSADTEIPAGTYYTNEYAKLTYTNFQGVKVENTFPVPQLTWNGAQVRYTFYLVNEFGQPVNRQGYVVPFADAVYVTDIFMDSMTWNEVQHYESFNAALMAENLLPSVYELYDPGASYNVHVFESEYGSDLNNHFFIGSSYTKEQVTGGNKAWTTFVFNNKADATKYNTPGYYALQDPFGCTSTGTVNLDANTGKPSSYTKTNEEDNQVVITYNGKWDMTTEEQEELKNSNLNVFNSWVLLRAADWAVEFEDNKYHLYFQNEDGSWYTIVNRNDATLVKESFDFANTTVAFAVVWKPGLKEDTVVVDFGLDVVIDVITNDVMIPGVVGLSSSKDNKNLNDVAYDTPKWSDKRVELDVGAAWIVEGDSANVRFSFDKQNGMQFNAPVTFYYEANVQYYDEQVLVNKYMYSSVTIIPATTIYYEDAFVTLNTETKGNSGWTTDEKSTWTSVGTSANKTQDCDRPGADKIGADYDADNLYGYDSAYEAMSKYSMGSAAMVNVYNGHRAKATFEFYGTGFDVISLTSNKTGTIMVNVYAWDKTANAYSTSLTKSFTVDTYYGYTKNESGEWETVDTNNPNALYQVPVMKIAGLTYGKYKVEIVAAYASLFDHEQYEDKSYDFYLDAIRIYDPCGTDIVVNDKGTSDTDDDVTVGDIYEQDGEGWPKYAELRNLIIDASKYEVVENEDGTITVKGENLAGAIFIDGNGENYSIADYVNYGPNNELYLAAGQSIAFDLNKNATEFVKSGYAAANVYLAIKTVGDNASVKVYSTDGVVALDTDLTTATDMYFDITNMDGKTVIIVNDGTSGIISLTNIKVTYETASARNAKTDSTTNDVGTFSLNRLSGNPAGIATMSTRTATYAVNDGMEVTAEVAETNTYLLSVNANTVAAALAALNAEEEVEDDTVIEDKVEIEQPVEPEVPEEPVAPEMFAPEKLEISVNKHQVKEGDKVKVTVITSGDVDYITVNGQTIAKYKADKRSGERTWTVELKTEQAGQMTIAVIAYNAEGVASEAKIAMVEVEAKVFNPKKLEISIGQGKIQEGDKVKVTIVTSDDARYITVNGQKIDKYKAGKPAKERTWIVELKAEQAGQMSIAVIAYNAEGVASEAKTAMVEVEAKVFNPKKLEISINKNKVKEGNKVKVTIVTSGDVERITVNGKTVTSCKTDKHSGERTWTVDLNAEEAGIMTIAVMAYNAKGVASEVKTHNVIVEAKHQPAPAKGPGKKAFDDHNIFVWNCMIG